MVESARWKPDNFVHLPFNAASPDPTVVDNFLKTIADRKNNPAFLHCASGNRAAAFWMIKRMQVDKWDELRNLGRSSSLSLAPQLIILSISRSHDDPKREAMLHGKRGGVLRQCASRTQRATVNTRKY
jgi:hypothetical protein